MAAVLAAGPSAVLSHRSAAALWQVRGTTGEQVDVTVPRALRARRGVIVHRARLEGDEVTVHRGIPVTIVARTLLDLAGVIGRAQLERAVAEAEVLRLGDPVSLAAIVARHAGRRGAPALRRITEEGRIGAAITRSELEDRFLALLDGAGLPRPEVNASLPLARGWVEVDCAWPGHELVVELDGYASHGTRAAFERDRARDRRLQAAGWRVIRVTWRQLQEEPGAIAAELRALLAA